VDAGMNDFIRPPLYGAVHRIEPLAPGPGRRKRYDIVGPVCESSDFFAKSISLPPVKSGDYLALFTAGAYGESMSSNYNSRPRAAEIAVAGNKDFVIRQRESFDDLTRGQSLKAIDDSVLRELLK